MSLSYTALVGGGQADGTMIVQTGTVTGDETDPIGGNDSASVTLTVATPIFTDGFESGDVARFSSLSGEIVPTSGALGSGRQQGTWTDLQIDGQTPSKFFDVFFDITVIDQTSAGCTVRVRHLSFMVEIDGENFRVEFSPGPSPDAVVAVPKCSSFALNFQKITGLLLPAVQ